MSDNLTLLEKEADFSQAITSLADRPTHSGSPYAHPDITNANAFSRNVISL